MKNRTIGIIGLVFSLTLIGVPLFASAVQAPNIWPGGFWGPLLSCTGDYTQTSGTCHDLCDLMQTVVNVIYFAISIAVFVITPILFGIGAIMIMVAGANPGMLERGKKTLTGTIIGLAIILCSYLIISVFITALHITGIGGFGGPTCS